LAVDFFGVGSDDVEVVSASYEGLVIIGAEDVQSTPKTGFGEEKARTGYSCTCLSTN
jgi:hypothetical protein